MPALVVANAALLRLVWTNGGQPYAVNVLGVRNASAVTVDQALATTLSVAIKASFASSGLNTVLGTGVALADVGIRDIRTAFQPEFVGVGAPVNGTDGGDLLPLMTAVCITLRTALAGRSFRGRYFQAGFTETQNQAGGVPSATAVDSTVDFLTAVMGDLATSNLALAVISRPSAISIPPRVGNATPVTAIVSREFQWKTQRRRATPGI